MYFKHTKINTGNVDLAKCYTVQSLFYIISFHLFLFNEQLLKNTVFDW